MRCRNCHTPLDDSRAVESPATSALVDNYTYTCVCEHLMTVTVRSRTEPANPAPEAKGVGLRFTARGFGGTVVS